MQVRLAESLLDDQRAQEAAAVLRKCVHCGFCNVTCPTFQLQGNELDGPRGRLYFIKEILETDSANLVMQEHLDRCLTCLACETTCPANLDYSRALEIGREMLEQRTSRPLRQRLLRRLALLILPWKMRVGLLLAAGRWVRFALPVGLQRLIPSRTAVRQIPLATHPRRMLLLDGCVQEAAEPGVNVAARRVLDRLGISLFSVPGAGCCGALSYHLDARPQALRMARNNIDAWWPALEQGAQALVATSSACGLMLKEYGELLRDDPAYADKAARVAALCRDIVEVMEQEDLRGLGPAVAGKVAVHTPCTLHHGQKMPGRVDALLQKAGFELAPVADAHLCCGAAGTYMLLQKEFSEPLLAQKKQALTRQAPDLVVSANIGCQLHLSSALGRRVGHWIELFDGA